MIIVVKRSAQVRPVHRGPRFSVEAVSWRDGQGRALEREVVRHPGAVLIVPLLDEDRLVLIGNFRVAVNERLWELPAGTLEPPEPPLDAARRELEEETGYRAAEVLPLGQFYTSPGFCDELMHVFTARGLEKVGQRLEAGEDIEVRIVGRDEALGMIADGSIRDGKTIAGLHLLLCRGAAGHHR